jgi:hypothetical protein
VFDLGKSKRFWCDVLGFQIAVMTHGTELREGSVATGNFWCRTRMAICCGSRRIWGRGSIAELASIRIRLPAQESAP